MASSVGWMSSTAYGMPSWSATCRPRVRLVGEESFSGSIRPKTLLGPRARAASAAHTALSTPPDSAMMTPRRRSVSPTILRRLSTMRSTSAAASTRSTSEGSRPGPRLLGSMQPASVRGSQGALGGYEVRDVLQAVEVVRNHLVVAHLYL